MTSPAPIQSADLSGIIDRLEKATWPDRGLDRLIQCGVGGWHRVTPSQARNKHGAFIAPGDWIGAHGDGSPILDSLHGTTMHRDVPAVTASVDAAIALAERVLPGFAIIMGMNQGPSTKPWARAGKWTGADATGPNLAIAICLATLRALRSKGDAQ